MNRLIYADSESCADLFYATKFNAPDAFLYFEKGRRKFVVLNSLEYDRGVREARVSRVLNLNDLIERMGKQGIKKIQTADWIAQVLKDHRVGRVLVPSSFPIGLGDFLRKKGVKMEVEEGALFPDRLIKQKSEIAAIRKSLKVTSQLLEAAIQTLRKARYGKNRILKLRGKPLRSEDLHNIIRMEASRVGFSASNPIVAGGIQGCDPHERGKGVLRANELIIIDIFPRDLQSGYWGDMTRTVVRGRASDAQRRLFKTVQQGQKIAFSRLKAEVDGQSVHEAVEQCFLDQGYATRRNGRYEGFFHGTGHGLGLEIHESPRVSKVHQKLAAGHVVTVEPGLYYPEIGGVRIEDVVLIQKKGCEVLSQFPVQLEI